MNWIEGVPRTRVEMRHELRFFKFDPGFHPLDIGNLHDIVEHTWSAEYGPQVSNADHRYAIEVSKFMNFVDMHGKPIPTKILYFIFDRTVANPNNPIFLATTALPVSKLPSAPLKNVSKKSSVSPLDNTQQK